MSFMSLTAIILLCDEGIFTIEFWYFRDSVKDGYWFWFVDAYSCLQCSARSCATWTFQESQGRRFQSRAWEYANSERGRWIGEGFREFVCHDDPSFVPRAHFSLLLARLGVDARSTLSADTSLYFPKLAWSLGASLRSGAAVFSAGHLDEVVGPPTKFRTRDHSLLSWRARKNRGETDKHMAKIPHVVSATAHRVSTPAR